MWYRPSFILSISLFSSACRDESTQVHIAREQLEDVSRDWNASTNELDLHWFARASLDIRGFRPTESEISWAVEHPDQLSERLSTWLAEEAFGRQMGWYWNDVLHTAVWPHQDDRFMRFLLTEEDEHAVGWEPLAYVEQVVNSGAPFTALVTTSQVPTNRVLAEIFGDESNSTEWELQNLEREHPSAGVISSRVLWIRHFANPLNHNRLRANFYSTTFLCLDFLQRDVTFDFTNIDLGNIDNAVREQPECVTCHAALDPLASVFGPFQDGINLDLDQVGMPSAFKQKWFAGWLEPSYFGLPLNDLSDLGAYTASDARFAQCMVSRTWDFLVEESELSDVDRFSLAEHFVDSGHSIQELVSTIVQSPEYIGQSDRVLRTEQLMNVVHRLQSEPSDTTFDPLLWSPEHRVMFGSTDDIDVLTRNPAFTVGHHLLLDWIVEELTDKVIRDLREPLNQRTLLTLVVDGSENSAMEQMRAWKRVLHTEWVDSTDSEIQDLLDLWRAIKLQSGEDVAWATVLAVLIHDPKMVMR